MKIRPLATLLCLTGLSTVWAQGLNVSGPTTEWSAVSYGTNYPDPSNDQQTGSEEGDIVGNQQNPALYTQYVAGNNNTDGTIGWRLRLGADKNPPGFTGSAFIGMDLNHDGALDIFAGVNNSGSQAIVGIWNAGTGANISPSTTTLANNPSVSYTETSGNYLWQAVSLSLDPTVTSTDINGGGDTDYFLTFSLPFSDLVAQASNIGISLNRYTQIGYVAATSTQGNSLNQDVNGINGNAGSSSTWIDLGALSQSQSPMGVPEPGMLSLLAVGILLASYLPKKTN